MTQVIGNKQSARKPKIHTNAPPVSSPCCRPQGCATPIRGKRMAFLLLVLPFLEPVVNQRHELLERPTLSIPPGQEKLCDFPDKRGRCRTPFVVRSLQYSRRV